MKRIMLFVITNLAIVLVLGVVINLVGVGQILDEQGVGLDLYNLLIFASVFGFGGSLISLAISKWTAKRMTGAQVITSPRNEVAAWLLQTVDITSRAAQVIFAILASIIVLWFSRQREFRADAGSAHLAGREKMIAALEKLRRNGNQPHLPDQMAAFGISGGLGQGFKRFFMTHPPLKNGLLH